MSKLIFYIGLLLVVYCLYVERVQCANILGVFPVPSVSHQVVFQPIWKELSLRGHQVTVLTPNPLNDPTLINLTEIDLGFSYDIMKRNDLPSAANKKLPMKQIMDNIYKIFEELFTEQLTYPPVQDLIKDKSKTFDVVLVEFFHPLVSAFSARFNCPMIGVMSLGAFITGHDAVGNPTHPVISPDIILPFMGELGFFERLYSTYFSIWYRYYHRTSILPKSDEMARKYISPDLPYLGDLEKNLSMLFLNVNPIIHPVRPNVPAVIELGRMHIGKRKPLPQDLQKELDSAKEGVVYFSLGSNVKSCNLTDHLRETIISALSELPYKVLWKWETDYLPNQPKNVITRKWLPQQDLLGHRNIKVFVTQGGLQSMEEAISNSVPLVAMPFFGDQPLNAQKMVKLGIAKSLETETLTKDELKSAIVEVAENPKYKRRIREVSNLLSDVPMTGLEKAVWWTEYVIRHKGAGHLRSPAVDMPWYKYLLLDVIGFVLTVTIISIFVVYKVTLLCIGKFKKLLVNQNKVKDS